MNTQKTPAHVTDDPTKAEYAFSRIRPNSASVIGNVRIRHSYGSDGNTYRGYVPVREKSCSVEQRANAGRNLVKVKALSGVTGLRLSARTLQSLLKYSLAGRGRQLRVVEAEPGQFHVSVTYRPSDGSALTLGAGGGEEHAAVALVSESGLYPQLMKFARMESAFESGTLDPSEVRQVLAAGDVPPEIMAKVRAARKQ